MLLSLSQAAQTAGLATETLRSWRKRLKAKLPLSASARQLASGFVKLGGRVLVSEDHLQQWIREQRTGIRPHPGPIIEARNNCARLAEQLREIGKPTLAGIVDGVTELLQEPP